MIKPQQLIEIGLITATLSVMLGESVLATSSQLKTSSSSPQPTPIIIAQNSSNSEADRLLNEGFILFQQGTAESLREALEKLQAARELYRAAGDRRGEADYSQQYWPCVLRLPGRKTNSPRLLNQALPLLRAVEDRRGEAYTLTNMAFLQRSQGELTEALVNMEKAINLTEELRSLAPPGELRQTFFSTVQDRYQLYIELLMELHQQNPPKKDMMPSLFTPANVLAPAAFWNFSPRLVRIFVKA